MFNLKSIIFIFVIYITFIAADDGGLSDIPFNGTPDDVEDAFRTKLAVEMAEKNMKTATLNKKILSAVYGGMDIRSIGAAGAVRVPRPKPRPIDINAAGGRAVGLSTYENFVRR
uniref:Uncharacterized protein n=1 Tax=Panagrolaimus sp. ES5 TaxID=591445 RepID=A0AC34FZ14_9BILA